MACKKCSSLQEMQKREQVVCSAGPLFGIYAAAAAAAAHTTGYHRIIALTIFSSVCCAVLQTFGISRDDAQAKFLQYYTKNGLLALDPFETVDAVGVGELIKLAVERGRATRPDIELGICGEHGGDPVSINLFEQVGCLTALLYNAPGEWARQLPQCFKLKGLPESFARMCTRDNGREQHSWWRFVQLRNGEKESTSYCTNIAMC
jgi:hypothetical protein